jgi:hypothetical protein
MNYNAHSKFVSRWLDKLEAEDAAAATATDTAEIPQAVPATKPTE